jgi:hypothetical protein
MFCLGFFLSLFIPTISIFFLSFCMIVFLKEKIHYSIFDLLKNRVRVFSFFILRFYHSILFFLRKRLILLLSSIFFYHFITVSRPKPYVLQAFFFYNVCFKKKYVLFSFFLSILPYNFCFFLFLL